MTARELEAALAEVPILDVHTHLVGGKLAARGLHDVLLYHMVVSDLYAAGCPTGLALDPVSRLAEPGRGPRADRRGPALLASHPEHQFLLGRPDHPPRPLRLDRADRRTQLAEARRPDPRAGRRPGLAACDPRPRADRAHAAPSSPGAAAARTTTGSSTPWNGASSRAASGASSTRPSTSWNGAGASRPRAPRRSAEAPGPQPSGGSERLDDVHEAVAHYVTSIPYGRIVSTATHLSTDIDYRPVSDDGDGRGARRDGTTPGPPSGIATRRTSTRRS